MVKFKFNIFRKEIVRFNGVMRFDRFITQTY